jgi:sugar/nucleoside kinase (ribokinase family)
VRSLFVGLTVVDVSYYGIERIDMGSKNSAGQVEVTVGGPAANAARVLAQLGGSTVLATALGGGPFAQFARGVLTAEGVSVADFAPNEFPEIPVSAVMVHTSGERTLVSNLPAEFDVLSDDRTDQLLAGIDSVLIDCHYPVLAKRIACDARSRGIAVVLDIGSPKAWSDELAELADAALVSSDFLPDPGEQAAWARRFRDTFVAFSRGSEPVLWWHRDQHGRLEVPRVDAIDTNGAGDVLHGAFMQTFEWRAPSGDLASSALFALERAIQHASMSCTRRGVV